MFDDFKSIETWDVSNVTSMAGLYNTCNCFNHEYNNVEDIPDLTYWDVSSVTNMSGMFSHIYGGAMFNQNISGWDVSNVTNMYKTTMDLKKLFFMKKNQKKHIFLMREKQVTITPLSQEIKKVFYIPQ